MGLAAHAYVVEHFDRQKHAAQFVELVQHVALKKTRWNERSLVSSDR